MPTGDSGTSPAAMKEFCGRENLLGSINPMIPLAKQYTLRGSKAVRLADKLRVERGNDGWVHKGVPHGVLGFDIGNTSVNPDITTPDRIRQALSQMVLGEQIPYTRSTGDLPLKKQISKAYGVPEHEIMVVNGVTEALGVTSLLFANTGGSVVVNAPVYPPWIGLLTLYGIDVRKVMRKQDGTPDTDGIAREFGENTNGYVTITAGNPDGLFGTLETEERAALALHRNMLEHGRIPFLVVDDIYREQIPNELAIDHIAISERYAIPLIYMSGIDKSVATGLHGGIIILHVPEALNGLREKIYGGIATIFDMYLGANTLTQRAMKTFLEEYEFIAPEIRKNFTRYRQWSKMFCEGLERTNGLRHFFRKPDLGLYQLLRLPRGIDSDEFAAALVERHGIAVTPGKSFCLEGEEDGIRTAMLMNPVVPVEIAPIISSLIREF